MRCCSEGGRGVRWVRSRADERQDAANARCRRRRFVSPSLVVALTGCSDGILLVREMWLSDKAEQLSCWSRRGVL